jgi:threonine dehydratase
VLPFDLPTPLVRAASLSDAGCDVYLKNETVLPTGTFKVRGAVHALTAAVAQQPIREVVVASTGNHGAAIAYAGQLLGVKATIFVPVNPNAAKTARIRTLGATVVEAGADLSAAIDAAEAYANRTGAFFLPDASHPDIPVGTATIGTEIVEQLPTVERVYVPMGDTALIRGVAAALKRAKPSIAVVGVAADRAPAYVLSWRQRRVVETATANTIADGLAVRRPLESNVDAILQLVDEVQTVTEDELLAAIKHLYVRDGIVAEPAGAAATAAFLKDANRAAVNVLLVTGCNLAPELQSALCAES